MKTYFVCTSNSHVLYIFVVEPKLVNEFKMRMLDFTKSLVVQNAKRRTVSGYVCIDFPILADSAFRVIFIDTLEDLLRETINYANSMLSHGSQLGQVSSWAGKIAVWAEELGKLVSLTSTSK